MAPTDEGSGARLARVLFPDLAADLDSALAGSGAGADQGFDAWLDGRTEVVRAELGGAAFGAVDDAASRERFERAFAAARTVAGWVGLRVPEPEAFASAGVDFARLGAALAADPTLTPVAAPYGLGADGWRSLFARAASEERSPLGPLGSPGGGGGATADARGDGAPVAQPLVLASEAEREFSLLDIVPDRSAPAPHGPERASSVRWTLRLVPAGLAPAVLGLSFEHGPHASLPEMLMLQLTRVVAGDPLVDARSFTWLAGALADGRLAARHVYDSAERVVRINCREVGHQGPHLGARPPVG
ncbi:hypothetical protein [Leucobacter triazinivorans]|uniref:Uncharacterized protein n=1 Tax=Leucobacter triazinivorans TaxID=1784719 RepID=A0A4P6KBT6_9MICO|nr:hypothetical protein [Leucobacter triazinivorans]QBE47450.1 hypothetical protein EVS81_00190 [Leucobacter triazinivorans]